MRFKPPAPDPSAERPEVGAVDLHALYLAEAPRLSRFFRYRAAGSEESSDLVQETFLRLARTSRGSSIENPAAYLHRIARNLLFDQSRRHRRQSAVLEEDAAAAREPASPADQGLGLEASDMMNAFQRALDALPPRTREVFVLHRIDDLNYRAIADRLGIGVRTVEWHIAEALLRIRQTLDEE